MRRLTIMLLVLALIISSVACSSSKKENGTDKENDSSAKVEQRAKQDAPEENVKLTLGLPSGYRITPQEIVDGFIAEYPNYEVTIDETPWSDFATKLLTQISAGNPPNVFFQESGVIAGFGKKGAVVDLTEYINRDLKIEEYTSFLLAGKDPDGKIWGVPHGVNPIALAYNKKMFTDTNIPFPTNDWTYADMIETAKILTKDTDGDGKVDVYGILTGLAITNGWFPFIKSTGGQILDETKTKAMFDQTKSVEGLKLWASLPNELKIAPDAATVKSIGAPWQFFASEKCAMYIIQAGERNAINGKFPDLEWDVVMMPKGYEGTRVVPAVANNWGIFSRSDKKVQDAAWNWIKYYLSDNAQKIVGQKTPAGFPVKLSGLAEVEKNATKPQNMKAFIDGMSEAGTNLDDNWCWKQWYSEAQKVMNEVYEGKITAQEGANRADEAVQKVIDTTK